MAAGADKAKQRSLELFTQLGDLVYTGDDWTRAYYGDNIDRLRRIKTAYDPDNIFHFEQSIPPG